MSACAITLGGTTGSVLIKYNLGSNANTLTANFGDSVYVDSTATSVTYTNISGNLTASSGCVTITELTQICYIFQWESPLTTDPLGEIFNGILLNGSLVTIPNSPFFGVSSMQNLITSISTLTDSRIQLMSFKSVASGRQTNNNFLIIKIFGGSIPQLQVNNPVPNYNIHLPGVVSVDCVPVGYTAIPNCQ